MKKAFTLIELLVVMAIVGVLAGFVIIQMNGAINTANDSKKKANIDTIKKSLIIYGVENGETYPIETGCTIGSCTTLDPAVVDLLPSELNGGTYTYESDGSSFTLSAVLSSGYSYTYDSSTNAYSTNTPVNGACGSSNGAHLSSIPSTNLCTLGTASAVAGVGPWTWTCIGSSGGTTASCATGDIPLDGSCGSSNGSSFYTAPTENLCTLGTPSAVDGSGPWTWTCAGSYGGLSPACAANISLDGSCGSSNGENLSSIPTENLCSYGEASEVGGSGPWDWTCAGTNGGTTASCSTGDLPVAGVCGSSDGLNFYTAPSANLCSVGSSSEVSGSGPWDWTCAGSGGGATDSCSANLSVNGVCGTASGAYRTTAPSGSILCSAGTASAVSGSGPWTWTCAGLYGGTTSGTCTSYVQYVSACVSGGGLTCTETTVGGDAVYKYTLSGSTTGTTTLTIPIGVSSVQYLVVGGGGAGGGYRSAAGGGAGGFLSGTMSVSSGSGYTVTVGVGGIGNNNAYVRANSGANSVFNTVTAIGGGGGGAYKTPNDSNVTNGASGGSGGGGAFGPTLVGAGGAGTSGQGSSGGSGSCSAPYYGSGGGGGAGGIGSAGTGSVGGNGGAGLSSSITGTSLYYAAGGGGGIQEGGTVFGVGGSSIGGSGAHPGVVGSSGAANTGSGGGGGGYTTSDGPQSGGSGANGVTIIRFTKP